MVAAHFKIVMLGDSGVGKTSLVSLLSDQGSFSERHVPTVGAQFSPVEVNVSGKHLLAEIWDTAGQEAKAREVVPEY
jgi:small GTP-binding protein